MNKSETQKLKEQKAHKSVESIYHGRIITVRKETYDFKDEGAHVVDLVEHPGAVAVLPIAKDGRLLLIQQWRRAVGEILIEIPAGILESGEKPDECAIRELQEEIGFRANTLQSLGFMFTTPGFTNEKIYLFFGSDLEASVLPPDEHEAIDIVPMHLEEALKAIEEQRIRDAKTIVAILRYARRPL